MLKNKKYGFTIIEVVLVLAIADLIFLMVFVALPALQRNQRDTQRKNDMAKLKVAVESYKANNRGNLPGPSYMANNFLDNYVRLSGDEFLSPSGEPYEIRINYTQTPVGWSPSTSVNDIQRQPWWIHFGAGMKCDGSVKVLGNPNNFTIQMAFEGGGVYCIDG